jgi:hypothetical protein
MIMVNDDYRSRMEGSSWEESWLMTALWAEVNLTSDVRRRLDVALCSWL